MKYKDYVCFIIFVNLLWNIIINLIKEIDKYSVKINSNTFLIKAQISIEFLTKRVLEVILKM